MSNDKGGEGGVVLRLPTHPKKDLHGDNLTYHLLPTVLFPININSYYPKSGLNRPAFSPARRGHFCRELRSGAELLRIYAERGGGPQPAEIAPRVFPASRRTSFLLQLGARSWFGGDPERLRGRAAAAAVPPDVAGVGRLHFGAFSPARRAPEVGLDVSWLHQTHSDRG